VIGAIIELAEKAAKDPWEIDLSDNTADIKAELKKLIGADIAAAYKLTDKSARSNALNDVRAKAKAKYAEADGQTQMVAIKLTKKLEAEIVRGAILKDGQRIDGRTVTQVRPIESMVGFLPHPRFGAVHARRNPVHLHHHPGHQGRGADDRRPRWPVVPALHAALQLPPIRWVKWAASAPRVVVKSATASSHGAR
jgi:polyribonucleotide nucleotidyltransferase